MTRQPQDRSFPASGLTLHYLDWGRVGLPSLVCLHGITQTAHSWDEVAPVLAEHHHLFALDARGHGESDWPPDGNYSRNSQARDVGAFLNSVVRGPTVLAGLSMGGLTCLTLAAMQPELVRALIIIDIAPRIEARGISDISAFIRRTHEPQAFDTFVHQAMVFNSRRSEANIRARLAHTLKQLPNGNWTWKYDPRLRSFANVGQDLDKIWEEVREIRCPALIVRGEESPILAAQPAKDLAGALRARVATVAGAGHSVMGDNPAGFLAAVEPFLNSLD